VNEGFAGKKRSHRGQLSLKKPSDPWRSSHDILRFHHRSPYIHDKQSDFAIDSQFWKWSVIWSPNTMTLCQFVIDFVTNHTASMTIVRFHHRLAVLDMKPNRSPNTMMLRQFRHNPNKSTQYIPQFNDIYYI
jgi:hypothetical protein